MTALVVTVRVLTATVLLVLIEQGSRWALLLLLALIVIAFEMLAALRRMDRDDEGDYWKAKASSIDNLEP